MSRARELLGSGLTRVAACSDITWADQHDAFVLTAQRVWTQYWQVSRALKDWPEPPQASLAVSRETVTECTPDSSGGAARGEVSEGNGRRRSVRDVIPHSRLASYGNYYYDDNRERCYTSDQPGLQSSCCEHLPGSDTTECWMLPQVEYWFKRLTDERRDTLTAPMNNLKLLHCLAASEHWGLADSIEPAERSLRDRVRGVRHLWPTSTPLKRYPATSSTLNRSSSTSSSLLSPTRSPPFKIRVRRHTGQRALRCVQTQTRPTFCPDSPRPLQFDPNKEIRFDSPVKRLQEAKHRKPPVHFQIENRTTQRIPPFLNTSKHTARGTSADSKCNKNTTLSTRNRGKTPARAMNIRVERHGRCHDKRFGDEITKQRRPKSARNTVRLLNECSNITPIGAERAQKQRSRKKVKPTDKINLKAIKKEKAEETSQTSFPIHEVGTEKIENTMTETTLEPEPEMKETVFTPSIMPIFMQSVIPNITKQEHINIDQKRLYSTVLSMRPPAPIITPVVCKIQGLIRLTSKLTFPTISRKVAQADCKFEELEREALEQYKTSDESIDTKFKTLEKQAMDQYSGSGTSNSNTSCSSGPSTSGHCNNGHCSSGPSTSGHCNNGHCSSGKCDSSKRSSEQYVRRDSKKSGIEKCNEPTSSTKCNEETSSEQCIDQCRIEQCSSEIVEHSLNQKISTEKKSPQKHQNECVGINLQNIPELSTASTSRMIDLKNVHGPFKKDTNKCHQSEKSPRLKPEPTVSDTEESSRAKAPQRWMLYVMP